MTKRLTPKQARQLELALYEPIIQDIAEFSRQTVRAQFCIHCSYRIGCARLCMAASQQIWIRTLQECLARALEN